MVYDVAYYVRKLFPNQGKGLSNDRIREIYHGLIEMAAVEGVDFRSYDEREKKELILAYLELEVRNGNA